MIITCVLSTGCAKENSNEQGEKSGIITLNMFVITEEETSKEAAKAVQMAINEITVPQHKMLVKINYLTGDEYWDAVEAEEKAANEYALVKNTKKAEDAAVSPENEEGAEVKVPISDMPFNEAIDLVYTMKDVELENPQIDILVVDDYDKFVEMVKDERLAEIDIKYDRKAIVKYIHPTVLSTTQVDKKTYGIPTNFALDSDYEFLVFNKNLLDKYGYTVNDVKRIESKEMAEFLAAVKRGEPGVYPISDIPDLAGTEVFDDILFAHSQTDSVSDASIPMYMSNAAYMEYLQTVEAYRKNGYVAAFNGVTDAKYAVEYVVSNGLIDREWTDENGVTYVAYLYDIPRVSSSDAFASAMCVSASSLHKSEAAELIELFNLDSELANLLQYGIEGVHYRAEDGIATLIENKPEDTYRMNNLLTGNTFIKYTTADNADYIENAKKNNLSTAPSAFYGFNLEFDDASSKSQYEFVKTFSAKARELMENGEMTVAEVFDIAGRQLNAIGCKWNSSNNLEGVFGDIVAQQKSSAKANTASFILSEEAKHYNDVYEVE